MDEQNLAANELEVAAQQEEVTQEVQEVTAEPTKQPDVTQTQAFSQRLKEATSKAVDAEYDRLYGSEYGIHSKADYDKYMENARIQQEAEKRNIDPEVYKELQEVKQKLNSYEAEKQMTVRQRQLLEQETALKADPIKGSVYQQFETDIKNIVNNSKEVDYESAFAYVVAKNLDKVLAGTATKAEQTAVQKIINNQTTSPGSLSQGSDNEVPSIRNMADKDFDDLLQKVKRGEVKSL